MLPIRTILHPTDFSRGSGLAFRLACSLAHDYGARLVVLHIAARPVFGYGAEVIPPPAEDSRERLLEELQRLRPRNPKVPVEHRLAEGDAVGEILRAAEETKADVILMGTHGRTGLGRLLMGSVAEEVLRKAPCPVLTVKAPPPPTRPPAEPAAEAAGTPAAGAKG